MVWILNKVNKPIEVRVGSAAMNSASDVYMTLCEAKVAQQIKCIHETKMGHSGTGHIWCADCGKPFN